MKAKMISIALGCSFFILLMTLTLNAQQTKDNPAREQKVMKEVPPPPPPPVPVDVDEPMRAPRLDLPDLTDEQKEKIKSLDLNSMAELTPLRNQVKEKIARLNTVLTTQPFNEKEAFQLADEIGKIRGSMLKASIRHDQEIRKVLTQDQQIIFDSRPKPFLNPKMKQPVKKNKR